MSQIVSPLRYPGGKSRALVNIAQHLPPHFSEYREPFLGGGSVFIYLRQKFPQLPMWINDLNFDLFCFWKETQRDAVQVAARVEHVKAETRDGRALFKSLQAQLGNSMPDIERAVRFFILNRISFSGTVDSGGYSEGAYKGRFTDSSIQRLANLGPLLQGVRVTNEDYRQVIDAPGQDVFLFLDPPYLAATKSRLYGANGDLHTTFNHADFAHAMQSCAHQWLVTYDDTPEIRSNFAFARQYEWELQYGMNNYGRDFAPKGKEVFLTNYPLVQDHGKQLQLLDRKTKYKPQITPKGQTKK